MSAFLGLNIALSGLFANQRALGVTSHNIANANTKGYTRQRMDMTSFRPDRIPGLGTLGTGVNVTAVKQIRDVFIDFKLRKENATLGEWQERAKILKQVEGIFNEPSDSSITKLINDFYSSVQALNKNPENLTARTLVRQNAISLTEGIRRMSKSLKNTQKDLNLEVKNSVNEINRISAQIAKLNKIIYESELGGNGKNNDVRDQRNVLLDELSKYVKVDSREDDKGRFSVSIGGHLLVSHYRHEELQAKPRTDAQKKNPEDADGLLDVYWADGNKLMTTSGKLKGLTDARDNVDGDLKGIPYYINRLNEFADKFSAEINRIHQKGYGLKGSTGVAFFTINNMSTSEFEKYLKEKGLNGGPGVDVTSAIMNGVTDSMSMEDRTKKITENINSLLGANDAYKGKSVRLVGDKYMVVDKIKASELTIASDLSDLNKLATAENASDKPGDGRNMANIFGTRHNSKLFDWGSPEDFVKSLVSNLGVDGNKADNVLKNQKLLVNNFTTQRESVSGVSLDEEMTQMIKFQKSYQANAKMVNVFDEMLDTIVNRLGKVGR